MKWNPADGMTTIGVEIGSGAAVNLCNNQNRKHEPFATDCERPAIPTGPRLPYGDAAGPGSGTASCVPDFASEIWRLRSAMNASNSTLSLA